MLSLDGVPIDKSEDIKLLGVHIDDDLVFKKHVSELYIYIYICIKTTEKSGYYISRLRNLKPSKAKLLVYKVFILPNLTYCHLIWHFCKSSDKRKVKRIQERALRAAYISHSDTYEELLERANLPTLYNIDFKIS